MARKREEIESAAAKAAILEYCRRKGALAAGVADVDGVVLTLDEICAYLLDHEIARNKLPERLELVDEMRLTPTRKIIKGRLAARLDT